MDNRLEVIDSNFIEAKKNIGKVSILITALKELNISTENLQDNSLVIKIYQRVFTSTKKATPRLKNEIANFLITNLVRIKYCIHRTNKYICLFLFLHKVQKELLENFITGIHQGRHEYVWLLICKILNIPHVHRSTFNLRHSPDIIEIRKLFHLKGRYLSNILQLINQHYTNPATDIINDISVYASRFV